MNGNPRQISGLQGLFAGIKAYPEGNIYGRRDKLSAGNEKTPLHLTAGSRPMGEQKWSHCMRLGMRTTFGLGVERSQKPRITRSE